MIFSMTIFEKTERQKLKACKIHRHDRKAYLGNYKRGPNFLWPLCLHNGGHKTMFSNFFPMIKTDFLQKRGHGPMAFPKYAIGGHDKILKMLNAHQILDN